MVSVPLKTLIGGLKRLKGVFLDPKVEISGMIEEVIGFATKARKNGLVSLEQEAFAIVDPFLSKGLNLAVDGTDIQEIRKMLELEIDLCEHQRRCGGRKLLKTRAAMRPTVGIIGAVLGLIQVMKHLGEYRRSGPRDRDCLRRDGVRPRRRRITLLLPATGKVEGPGPRRGAPPGAASGGDAALSKA